jgi:hypothetical protein
MFRITPLNPSIPVFILASMLTGNIMNSADVAFITFLSFVGACTIGGICCCCIEPIIKALSNRNSKLPPNPKTLAYKVVRTAGDLEFNHMKDPLNTC